MDFANMKAKKVGVYTDKNVARLPAMKVAVDSLTRAGVHFEVYDEVRVEPTDTSFLRATDFAKRHQFDAFLAVGGGSVMDTCKAANLYMSDPEAEILDYVAKPIGKGKVVTCAVKPLVAIPTTSGTGSETTGTAVFDLEEMKAKVGDNITITNYVLATFISIPRRSASRTGRCVRCSASSTPCTRSTCPRGWRPSAASTSSATRSSPSRPFTTGEVTLQVTFQLT